MFLLILQGGLRPGEVLNLHLDDSALHDVQGYST
jgi:integrase